jgi:hypothetical protein
VTAWRITKGRIVGGKVSNGVTTMPRSRLPFVLVALLPLGGCADPDPPAPNADPPFQRELLQVAREYKAWGRVDDPMRFGIEYCRMPPPARPAMSASPDEQTHGKKLYSLFAKDRMQYLAVAEKGSAVGQVIVKQSWSAAEVPDMKPGMTDWKRVVPTEDIGAGGTHFYPYATKGDKVYKAAKPTGLFIMLKLDPKTPGTDDGWVYGTVTADGKAVTASGKVESCMKCHSEAKHDRLFGLPK